MRPILERRKDASVRVGIADNPASGASVAAIQQALGPLPVTTPPADAGLPSGVNPAAYSIYIQYGNAAGDFASKYGDMLSGIGFQVPPLEQVPAPPDVPEVRYYLSGQKGLAEWLAKRLDEQAPQRRAAIAKFIGSGDLPGASSRSGFHRSGIKQPSWCRVAAGSGRLRVRGVGVGASN